jgi:GT2 family glycosyltransferase/lipopolysaccharide/colanic/teichoic acid biosynthesis glycosyltransferase
MKKEPIKISIIIVNYNVKAFLEQALESVNRALEGIPSEAIVVDNNSIDGSVQMLNSRFKDVQVIASKENLGFSGGNNLALSKAVGEFIVLLNPDTLVQEDTFCKLLEFFENTPDASAATCKILNPDGTFSIDCRHSIPTPSTAFWKLIGLNKVFPKSKIFGRYNLTYLDENETYPVEAVSGSFMMIKKEVVDKTGLLDETFFMYCEDIDYCHRINLQGGKIYYVPDTQIVHYKGESSKANNLDYVITFNRSLYQFYKKHYQQKYFYPFKWFILLGVIFRGIVIYTKNSVKKYYPLLLDLAVLNTVLFVSFFVRYKLKHSFLLDDFFSKYIVINVITSVIYFISALFFDLSKKDRFQPDKVFKVLISTFLFVAALTFFFKQFAFSRFVVLIAAIVSSVLMIGWRVFFNKYASKYSSALGKEFIRKKTLIVGEDKETKKLLEKLKHMPEVGMDILGLAATSREQIGDIVGGFSFVTSLDQLEEYVRLKKIDMIIFSTHNISYEAVFSTMASLQNTQVEFKMVPGHLEFMVGKSNIERLDSVALVDIDYAYGRIFNRFVKRVFDWIFSSILLISGSPVFLIQLLIWRKSIKKHFIMTGLKKYRIFTSPKSGMFHFFLNLVNVWMGQLSFVGAPVFLDKLQSSKFEYKPGLTGIIQINSHKIENEQMHEKYELHYLKNQSVFLDVELLVTALFREKK